MVDTGRKYVQDFLQKWAVLDTTQFPGAGKDSISVHFQYKTCKLVGY